VRPTVAGALTPGHEAEIIESISNDTKISHFCSSADLIMERKGVKGSSRID
jgi:hypothetical protein